MRRATARPARDALMQARKDARVGRIAAESSARAQARSCRGGPQQGHGPCPAAAVVGSLLIRLRLEAFLPHGARAATTSASGRDGAHGRPSDLGQNEAELRGQTSHTRDRAGLLNVETGSEQGRSRSTEPVSRTPTRPESLSRAPKRPSLFFGEPTWPEPLLFREPARQEPLFREPKRPEPVFFREPKRQKPLPPAPARRQQVSCTLARRQSFSCTPARRQPLPRAPTRRQPLPRARAR